MPAVPRVRGIRFALATFVLALVFTPTRALAFDKELDAVVAALERRDAAPASRVEAARALVDLKGAKAAGRILDVALEKTTPYALQCGLADVLAGVDDDKTQGDLLRLLRDRKSDVTRKLFALAALRAPAGKDVEAFLAAFGDDDALVRQAALDTAVRLDLRAAVPRLHELLERTTSEDELRPVGGAWLSALVEFVGDDQGFVDALIDAAGSPLRSTRTTALRALAARAAPDEGAGGGSSPDATEGGPSSDATDGAASSDAGTAPSALCDDARLATLMRAALASDAWQDRSAGVVLARSLPPLVSVDALLEGFARQSGRLRIDYELALVALTSQNFHGDAERWAEWWTSTGKPALLAPKPTAVSAKPFQRRSFLGERSASVAPSSARFFEIDVDSHNVVFVVDISGSMEWPVSLQGEPSGGAPPTAEGESRIDVAREQLRAAIASLDAAARFDIIAFNDRARPWISRGGMAEFGKAGKRPADALRFIDALAPTDGTNLYGALEAAFADPFVDTIFLLSDGVPSLGEIVVPDLIRRSVAAWNAHRDVILSTIAMGLDETEFPLLRQLAEDSGGRFVRLP